MAHIIISKKEINKLISFAMSENSDGYIKLEVEIDGN